MSTPDAPASSDPKLRRLFLYEFVSHQAALVHYVVEPDAGDTVVEDEFGWTLTFAKNPETIRVLKPVFIFRVHETTREEKPKAYQSDDERLGPKRPRRPGIVH